MSRFDYSQLQRGLAALAKDGGKSKLALTTMAAKGFVKDIINISPPGSKGVSGNAAKKAGEKAILGDLAKLAQPVFGITKSQAAGVLPSAAELLAAHKSAWAHGHVNPRGRLEKLLVTQATFNTALRKLQSLVGWLAAGWNAAAAKLGVNAPAWVKRHGNRFGEHKVTATATNVRIEMSNTVGFVGDVKAYDRRVQAAINYQGAKMQRQSDALLKKRMKAAGL